MIKRKRKAPAKVKRTNKHAIIRLTPSEAVAFDNMLKGIPTRGVFTAKIRKIASQASLMAGQEIPKSPERAKKALILRKGETI